MTKVLEDRRQVGETCPYFSISLSQSPGIGQCSTKMEEALSVLTDSQKNLLLDLSNNYGQKHLVGDGFLQASAADRRAFGQQLEHLHNDYKSGGTDDENVVGLMAYIRNARKLLDASARGVNPLEGWEPSVPPHGARVEFGTDEYNRLESLGLDHLGSVGFVLVAGGLGERLGYSGIKVSHGCV